MICVSVAATSAHGCLQMIEGLKCVEIRMEDMIATVAEIGRIFDGARITIATCRPGRMDDNRRKAAILAAIDAGASFVDVELENEPSYRIEIIDRARLKGTKVIISFHDYQKTPSREELETAVQRSFEAGADICKIACRSMGPADNAVLLGLLGRKERKGRVIAVGMGEEGQITRIAAPFLGSPFTFACLSSEQATAEGQMEIEEMRRILALIDPKEAREKDSV